MTDPSEWVSAREVTWILMGWYIEEALSHVLFFCLFFPFLCHTCCKHHYHFINCFTSYIIHFLALIHSTLIVIVVFFLSYIDVEQFCFFLGVFSLWRIKPRLSPQRTETMLTICSISKWEHSVNDLSLAWLGVCLPQGFNYVLSFWQLLFQAYKSKLWNYLELTFLCLRGSKRFSDS